MTANPRSELLVERGFILLSKQTYLQLLNGSSSKGPLAMDKSEQTRLKGAKLRILYTPLIDAVRIQQLSMSNWGSNMKIVYKIHREVFYSPTKQSMAFSRPSTFYPQPLTLDENWRLPAEIFE